MKIILCARDEALQLAFAEFCVDLPNVVLSAGSITDYEVDAVVSPANSFGFMDGGIDAHYRAAFGKNIQEKVREAILTECDGELLVGQAITVTTGHSQIPYLIVAPTMRVPMILSESVNPYLATKAALKQAKSSGFESVAFPGMGTGVGRVHPKICAHQMMCAIMGMKAPASTLDAMRLHQGLYTTEIRDLQRTREEWESRG